MLNLPILRWGKPYESLEVDQVVHFVTGEPIAKVSQANGGLLQRDMRFAQRARDVLRELSSEDLIARVKKAGELYLNATLPMGDGQQSPEELPCSKGLDRAARAHVPVQHAEELLRAVEHGSHARCSDARAGSIDPVARLRRGRARRGRQLSGAIAGGGAGTTVEFAGRAYAVDARDPDAGRPGSQARPARALDPLPHGRGFRRGGHSREAISIYPGGGDVGAAVLANCDRSMIFGGTATVERYKGDPRVQAHGPGFSKILLGDDWSTIGKSTSTSWPTAFISTAVVVASTARASGRRDTPRRSRRPWPSGLVRSLHCRPRIRKSGLAAFTVAGVAPAVWKAIEADLRESGVNTLTEKFGPRLVEKERCAYLRPTVVECDSPERAIAKKEYMFPFTTVVKCPQDKMIESIGPDAGVQRHHRGCDFPAATDRCRAHRPLEHRTDPHHQAGLAAAARREHRGIPVPCAGLPTRPRSSQTRRARDGRGPRLREECRMP